MRSFPGIFLSLTMANARESGTFIGQGLALGLKAQQKPHQKKIKTTQVMSRILQKGQAAARSYQVDTSFSLPRGWHQRVCKCVLLHAQPCAARLQARHLASIRQQSRQAIRPSLYKSIDILTSNSFVFGIFAGLSGGFHFWHGGIVDEALGIKAQMGTGATPGANYDLKTKSFLVAWG